MPLYLSLYIYRPTALKKNILDAPLFEEKKIRLYYQYLS
jgi:hypothetical protein